MKDTKETRVYYICNKKNPKCSYACHNLVHIGGYYCSYTTNPEYAVNGPCSDPQNYPERFDLINDSYQYTYVERRDY